MNSIALVFVGYLIVAPHALYSWLELLRPKGKKNPKNRQNLLWNVGLSTLSLALLIVLTFESFTNEFSIFWFLTLLSIIILFLFWSLKFMPKGGA